VRFKFQFIYYYVFFNLLDCCNVSAETAMAPQIVGSLQHTQHISATFFNLFFVWMLSTFTPSSMETAV